MFIEFLHQAVKIVASASNTDIKNAKTAMPDPSKNCTIVCLFMAKLENRESIKTGNPQKPDGPIKYTRIVIGPAIPQACPLARNLISLLNITMPIPENK